MSTVVNAPKQRLHIMAILLATTLTIICSLLAIIAWRQINSGPLGELTTYDVFPLFGLLAFSLLWCLYMTDAAAHYLEVDNEALRPYYRITGYALLAVILVHPLLLIIPLWNDGFGLPPGSYEAYVRKGYAWVATLGSISLLAFLAYELRRWFQKRNWWKWVVYANDIAMLAILYHGLTIGGDLQTSWLRPIWFFYGIMLIIALIYLRIVRRIQLIRNN